MQLVLTNEDSLITKSNVLIEANYKLGATEQKIILLLASNIHPEDDDFKTYSLSIKEFHHLLGLKGSPKYSEIRQITKQMMRKVFEVRIDNQIIQVSWLSYVAYNEKNGTVNIRFDPFLKPYLLQLKKEFTSYRLKNVVRLKSAYSIRIYELLKQYESLKTRTLSLGHLRKSLGAEDVYPKYANFKQRVLVSSQKELAEKTDIRFEFEEIKKGRKVDKIKFWIESTYKEKVNPILDSSTTFPTARKVAKQLGWNIEESTWKAWERYEEDHILKCFDQVKYKEGIKNTAAYIHTLLKTSVEDADLEPSGNREVWKNIRQSIQKLQKSREPIPEWLVIDNMKEVLGKHISQSEIESWVEKYKEEWLSEVKKKA